MLKYFSYFFNEKTGDNLHEMLDPVFIIFLFFQKDLTLETICMKCQIPFSETN